MKTFIGDVLLEIGHELVLSGRGFIISRSMASNAVHLYQYRLEKTARKSRYT